MIRLLRDPLAHFAIGGAALFALYAWVGPAGDPPPDRIVVGELEIERLTDTFARTWMRPPTRRELDGLIDQHVTEEILYREALALGLDRDDLIVRRRMRQKMEFLNDDLIELTEPTEKELESFLHNNAESYAIPSRATFRQIYFNPAAGDAAAEDRAARALEALRSDSAADARGDPTLLPPALADAAPIDIDRVFGTGFAAGIANAPVGEWSGPLASGFGSHLVYVEARRPAVAATLEDVRAEVTRDWQASRRTESRALLNAEMRKRYDIEIRMPAALQE